MNEENTIRVLYLEPEKEARVVEIADDLDAMQELVGGYIEEYMPFDDDVALVCNEEGKMNGLPLNRAVTNENGEIRDVICGSFFLCNALIGSESFLSLTEEQEKKYREKFRYPERFYRDGNGIRAVKFDPKKEHERSSEAR